MRQEYRGTSARTPVWVTTGLTLLAILFVFVIGVAIFRRAPPQEEERIPRADDIVSELTETSPEDTATRRETPRGIPETAELTAVGDTGASATAKRVFENGFFKHTVLARGLPDMDTTRFQYQAWLIRPYPFDFISTGTLVHNADGSWGMLWVGEPGETYDDFLQVLVTLEPKDYDENPSANQVLKGSF
ncbi:hypothetical protein HYW18_01455 [Candidatus Uhrbacteria bacterium]|nr:hypothetical protein [Candidatus Uhrbacteria bacterium]